MISRTATCIGCVILAATLPASAVPEPPAAGYAPVAPASALQFALRANLKLTRDWLDDKDFASAAQATQGLTALAHLYGYHSAQPRWRERTAALQAACAQLEAAARRKDAVACASLAQKCAKLLDELGQDPPSGDPPADKSFKPAGSTKTWMLLLEGAYVDAKSTKSARELELLALALAEESNALSYLRSEPRWRTMSQEIRALGLQVAGQARASDLEAARRTLKKAYERCEACHQGYKR